MSEDVYYVGEASALLLPNRYKNHPVEVKRNHAGVIILVHGVNDVGVSYPALDAGLCAGLNDRLDRPDLFPNDFRLPKEGDEAVDDPDAIFYQRVANDRTNSPVIHFHWGYRAGKRERGKEQVYGQNVDEFGNRLDARFAKMGGMFANATSNIPDMFGGRFKGGFFTWLADQGADSVHSLKQCPDRRYMALAAKRLAALIRQVRRISRNETITLVAHSQGCLVSLCAQAFLHQDGGADGYADCLIMNHPPYGIHEPWLDYATQSGHEQQTSQARVETLINLVKLITDQPHPLPELRILEERECSLGRTGRAWTPSQGRRPWVDSANLAGDSYHNLADPAQGIAFPERDNRGKVYLYFCPQDRTVGLANVQGIGTLGVPQAVNGTPVHKHEARHRAAQPIPLLGKLGPRFLQRVWSWRHRGGQPTLVGAAPGLYTPRESGEPEYDGGDFIDTLSSVALDPNEQVQITGEALNPPFRPDLHYGEDSGAAMPGNMEKLMSAEGPGYIGQQNADPIDACDALVKGGLPTEEAKAAAAAGDQEQAGRLARQHYQNTETFKNSYHSSIVANPEHHRWVTAMDVAIGQAWSIDNPFWLKLLQAMADWRTDWDKEKEGMVKYDQLDPLVRELVEATAKYYQEGVFPGHLVPTTPPAPIVSQTRAQRSQGGRA
ncbi:T6SS effector phospholipase Tle3 domain-containing protein [Paludibacterium purpuratum]|uniref:Uncharacterized protein DUF3274 n=1 Tax=Paludibacterium purpuratum TaxID=1144873 RepID=A0A4R7BFV8_9NEIS|nr:DUF3274 domain-containing protein [Paludibacterium purpuratum]TDR82637.1 uncharacterized protein DUF3274 [Paludibacterium purpuratum]